MQQQGLKVGHLTQVADRSMVTYIENDQPKSFWVEDVVLELVKKAIAEGEGWPAAALYKVEYVYHLWPKGWEKDLYVHHFSTDAELEEFLAEKREWAKAEDNEIKIEVYKWDLGPQFHATHHYR